MYVFYFVFFSKLFLLIVEYSTEGHRCPKMNEICARTRYKAAKLVRATMEEIQHFILQNRDIAEDIKILHLLRDPRGRLNSFLKYHSDLRLNHLTPDIVSTACERQMKDVRIRKQLEEQFPGMFLEIRYEDVASDPVTMATRIYHFVYSQDVPDEVKQWISYNTNNRNGSVPKEKKTFRRNSTATSLAWKQELSVDYQNLIKTECKDLLQHLNLA